MPLRPWPWPCAAKDAGRKSPVLVSSLKLVGSCRGDDDAARLAALQEYAQQLGLCDAVEWHVNVPYSELRLLLGGAVGGLHTMLDEHFGISVVEYMAAGVLMRAVPARAMRACACCSRSRARSPARAAAAPRTLARQASSPSRTTRAARAPTSWWTRRAPAATSTLATWPPPARSMQTPSQR